MLVKINLWFIYYSHSYLCFNFIYKVLPGEISVFIFRLIRLFPFDFFYVVEKTLFTNQSLTCFTHFYGIIYVYFLIHLELILDMTIRMALN